MKITLHSFLLCLALAITCNITSQDKKAPKNSFNFDFGKGKVLEGFIKITPKTIYKEQLGYGIDRDSKVISNKKKGKGARTDGFITGKDPFYFSVKLPEGNYHIIVVIGDDCSSSDVSIRAENRRMMVNRIETQKGEHKTIAFTVNIRDSLISGSNKKVNLKDREYAYLHWDNKLTLEFNSSEPKINTIEITPDNDAISIFLAGDSTVVDGINEPYSAWGQMFPSFFKPGKVAIVNLAESGETLKAFINRRRFEKLLSMMKPGDYAFVQFGHNDQKQKGKGVGAFTTYKNDLKYFIDEVKKKGGIPVLMTSVQRRRFNEKGNIVETLGNYPDAVRLTAKEQNTALIDLNATSKVLFETMGVDGSLLAFAHFPLGAYPRKKKAIKDNTHFRPYGAYEVSKLVLQGVRNARLGLVKYIKDDIPNFSPLKPGAYTDFYWPESPVKDATKPEGN